MKKGFVYLGLFVFGLISIVTTGFLSGEKINFETARNRVSGESASTNAFADKIITAEETAVQKQKIAEEYGKLPIIFEPNAGQTDERVKFLARGSDYSLFLTDNETVLSLEKTGKNKNQTKRAVIKMRFDGANHAPKSFGSDETEGKSNYFIGSDSAKWQTNVANSSKVKYEAVYEGVDAVYYGNNQQLEYDFIIAPNANPNQIKLKFDGVKKAEIENRTGDLLLETEVGTIRQHKPFSYQIIDGEQKEIASLYKIKSSQNSYEVSFKLAAYDKSKELIIDPILAYGSYLGGNAFDEGRSIAVDANGNAYIVGTAASRDFPTTAGTIKPVLLPRTDAPNSYWYDAFVTKVNPAGTAIVFSTYFGGRNGNETGSGAAVDANGNVLISGTTTAVDLPTVNAFQQTFGGTDDGFAAKLNSTGSEIIFSTYLGGKNTDLGGKITVNQTTGEAVFVGTTGSPNQPTTPGAYKEQLCTTQQNCVGISYNGSYLSKFAPNGDVIYSTLFNASINDVTLDANDNATFGGTALGSFPATSGAFQTTSSGGTEGIIAKLNAAGNAVVYGTFLGGGLQSDRVKGVTLDADGNIYVTGQTENTAFPTTAGAYDRTFNGLEDTFVVKLNAAGSALVYSTFYGSSAKDEPFAIGLSADRNVFITGETTNSTNFPLKNSLVAATNGTKIFLARFNADASQLVFSTLLGLGGGYDLAIDAADNAYLTGHAVNIPLSPNAFQPVKGGLAVDNLGKDAFVMKISPADESLTNYSISGTVTTQSGGGFGAFYPPVVVTLTGSAIRRVNLPYYGGQYSFGNLPAGGSYTVTVSQTGYIADPNTATFNNLGANQFADFAFQPNEYPEGTIISPAHGTTYNAPASITIQATAFDPEGQAITKVDFFAYNDASGNIPLGTDTTAPYEFTWTNVPVGTYSLSAVPTDSQGLPGYSTEVVHVFVVSSAPLSATFVTPTEGQTFTQGDYVPIKLNVSSSVARAEVRDQNNELVAWLTNSPWSSQWRVMEVGNYTLTAKAFDSQENSVDSAPVNIVVAPINHRISGKIRDSITGNGIGGVTLNLMSGSNSNISATTATGADGGYSFTNLGATPNDSVSIKPVSSSYTFDPPVKNIGYLGYINWENENFVATSQTQIDVAMTSPTSGQTFFAPATINLAAAATSGAGAITKVEFYQQQGASNILVGTDTTAPFEHQLTNVPVGNFYYYYARATDATGAAAESQGVSVTVRLPTVSFSGRITNAQGAGVAGVTVYIAGGAAWTEDTDANGNFTFSGYPGGENYYITPTSTGGVSYTPASRSYTNVTSNVTGVDFVASAPNQPPTVQITSPTDGATFTMPQAIPISVTANDPDNNITNLRVTAGNGQFTSTIAQTANSTINFSWQPSVPGTYTLTAIARDSFSVQVTAQITITVNPPAPLTLSGRVVNRDSEGIEAATIELRDFQNEETIIASAATDASGNYAIPNVTTFGNYIVRVSKLNYTFAPPQRAYFNLAANQFGEFTGTLALQPSDFDGDAQTDIAVWRPSTGDWHIMRSNSNSYTGIRFGAGSLGDIAVPGNYDGDGKIDIAVYRGGTWFIYNSSNAQVKSVAFGFPEDTPVAGDYDGDGKTDVAVFRPKNGTWYILRSSDNRVDGIAWGNRADIPLVGDFDGDGRADVTVFRPSNGTWYIRRSSDGAVRSEAFGASSDVPVIGDFDGDKKTDICVFRPSNGIWYRLQSSDSSFRYFLWGTSGDVPVAGDYDLDGKTDFAVFRKASGAWYILKSSTNTPASQFFGANGDVPIPAASIR